jgi:hypothetical protein
MLRIKAYRLFETLHRFCTPFEFEIDTREVGVRLNGITIELQGRVES